MTEDQKADILRCYGIEMKECKYRGWVLDGWVML